MKIDHVAIWVNDLEKMRAFYVKYFNGKAGSKYHNRDKGFTSYFISFDSGARIELMHRADIPQNQNDIIKQFIGLNHLAISLDGRTEVDQLTQWLEDDGYIVLVEPRTTGDGYYESVILDPEDNRIEIMV